MNKKFVALTIGLVVLIGGSVTALALTRGGDNPADNAATTSTTQPSSEAAVTPVEATETNGAYVDYSPTAIANAEGDTLLFFYAAWCPSCRTVEADILSSGVPAGVTVIKVDYDTHQDLRQKYGVTVQTTFVKVDSEGEAQGSFTPSSDLTIAAVVSELT